MRPVAPAPGHSRRSRCGGVCVGCPPVTGFRLCPADRAKQPGGKTMALLSPVRGEAGSSVPQAPRSLATHWASGPQGESWSNNRFFPKIPDQSHKYRHDVTSCGGSDALTPLCTSKYFTANGRVENERTVFLNLPRFPCIWLFLRFGSKHSRFPDTQKIN